MNISEKTQLESESGESSLNDEQVTDVPRTFTGRLTIQQLRQIWNDKETQYTDKQLFKIRDWLYTITDIILSMEPTQMNEHKPKLTIHEKKEGHFIHPGQYGRTG